MGIQTESRIYRLTGLSPLLGGQPASKAIREQYVASKAPTEALMQEEMETNTYDRDEKGVTVFARDNRDHLCLMSHQIKGFFKEALTALKAQVGIAAIKGKVDTLMFVEPRYIPLKRDGQVIIDEDEMLERPLRAETMRGPRTALQSSELINDPWSVEIEITLLPNVGTAKSACLTWDAIEAALEYGAFHGLGQWRNAGYGQFRFEQIEDEAD